MSSQVARQLTEGITKNGDRDEDDMTNTTAAEPTLVLGATGKTGRRVADRLTGRGLPVRRGSRSAEIPFDWADRSTYGPAVEGVAKVYLSYQPDLCVPGAPDDVRAFAEAAAAAGVRHLVMLSGRGEPEAEQCEQVVRESGLEWTIVRASWFFQNFSETFNEELKAGELVLPVGDVREPFVDAEDIAEIAVAALTEDGHTGQLYEVTGPRMLTFEQAVAEIAEATGREIAYVQVPAEAFAAGAAEQGLPEDVVSLLMYLFTTVLDGRNAYQTDGVKRALGREPGDFADFARRTAATGVWA
jgi:uncharacterized protein YbjT (DUF2867 family)